MEGRAPLGGTASPSARSGWILDGTGLAPLEYPPLFPKATIPAMGKSAKSDGTLERPGKKPGDQYT
jgi:hypothetical protein